MNIFMRSCVDPRVVTMMERIMAHALDYSFIGKSKRARLRANDGLVNIKERLGRSNIIRKPFAQA
jgi:hypothetical protein